MNEKENKKWTKGLSLSDLQGLDNNLPPKFEIKILNVVSGERMECLRSKGGDMSWIGRQNVRGAWGDKGVFEFKFKF